MKKLVLLLMCLVLVLATPAVLAGNIDMVGGITFNTFDLEQKEDDGDIYGANNQLNGSGLYAGGRYWLNDKMAAGLGYDYIEVNPNHYYENQYESGEFGTKMDLQGFYGELLYKVTDYIKVKGSLTNYNISAEYYSEHEYSDPDPSRGPEDCKGSGMGYLIGAEMCFPLTDSLKLNSELSYHTTTLDMDNEMFFFGAGAEESGSQPLNLKGVRFSLGLNYAF